MYEKLEKFKDGAIWKIIQKIVNFLMICCGISVVVLIFSAVIARYFFKTDIYGVEEIILTVAFWLYFAGSINGSMEDSHIKADLMDVYITNHRIKYIIKSFAKLIESVVYLVVSGWAINLFAMNLERMPRTTGLKIPIALAQFPIAAGFVFMVLFALYYCLLYFSFSWHQSEEA